MNRRAFLSLVATAPLVAALKPWRPAIGPPIGFQPPLDAYRYTIIFGRSPVETLLREIAVNTGVPYEELIADYP